MKTFSQLANVILMIGFLFLSGYCYDTGHTGIGWAAGLSAAFMFCAVFLRHLER